MKAILLSFYLFFSLVSFGQDEYPTYKINGLTMYEIDTLMNGSIYHYNYATLLERFDEGDYLDGKQLTVLYYGAALDMGYGPYKTMALENEVHVLNNINQYKQAIELSDTILKTRPTSMMALLERSFAMRKERDTIGAKLASFQIRSIKNTVLGSGDGKTPQTAYIVTSRKDIDIINAHNRYFVIKTKERQIDKIYYSEYTINVKGGKRKVYYNVDLIWKYGLL
jgi:hypothetical protein